MTSRIEFDLLAADAARLDLGGHGISQSIAVSWSLHPTHHYSPIRGAHVTLSGSHIIITGDVQTCVFMTKELGLRAFSWLVNRQTRDVTDSAAQGMSDTEYMLVEDLDAHVAGHDLDWIAERLKHRPDILSTIARAKKALSGGGGRSAVIEAQDVVAAERDDVEMSSIREIGKVTSRRVHVAHAAVRRVWDLVWRDVEMGKQ